MGPIKGLKNYDKFNYFFKLIFDTLYFILLLNPLGTITGPKTNYMLHLYNFFILGPMFEPKMSLDRAYQDLKFCIWG